MVARAFSQDVFFRFNYGFDEKRKLLKVVQDVAVEVTAESAGFETCVIEVLRIPAFFNVEIVTAGTQLSDVGSLCSAFQREVLFFSKFSFDVSVE